MEVQTYRLPIAYFPRMNYAYKNSLDIYNKYRRLTADFVEEETEITKYESVVLHFCKKKTERQFPAELNEVIKPENEQSAENTTYPNVSSILNEQPKQKWSIFVIVLDISLFDETAKLSSGPGLFVFIANSLAKSEGNLTDNCIVTTKDRVGSDICNRLEKIVLNPMPEILVFLERARKHLCSFPLGSGKNKDPINVSTTKHSVITQDNNFPDKSHMTDSDVIYQGFRGNHSEAHAMVKDIAPYSPLFNRVILNKRTYTATEGHMEISDAKKQTFMKKNFHDIIDLHRHGQIDAEAVESLLKSIKVLYGMSNIPENEKPLILDDDRRECIDELCKDLFSVSKYVKGVGYYCSTLRVLVSEKAAEKEPKVKEQIENILKQHSETKFEIVEVSENIHNLMHVGAKLEPVPGYGTLGCFAKKGERTCILLSAHVAQHGSEMFFESKRKVCRILKETTKIEAGDLDIAAAEINQEEVICSSDFKDSEGNPMKGKLRDYIGKDKVITEKQKVHIWGASSTPGKGVIEMPKVVMQADDCRQVLMQIKDGDTKFAIGGDSGAIVCTDDPDGNYVHVLGMVMGEGMMKRDGSRYYFALPLSDGLKQLEKKTGQKFELC